MITTGGGGGNVYSAFLLLNSCSLSMVRQIESRKNLPVLQAGDGERTVLTTEGGCVNSGSSSSVMLSSLSESDGPSAVR